jgi:LuxR family maltose regulon positive regulatory protein
LTLLASAFARISPGNSDLIADMRGLGVSVLGRAAPRLASALRTSPVPFVLMLDDLHELRSPACHDVLGVVISGIPRGSQLVAASRFEQPHLPRLRVAGDALELLTDDLALDAAGAEHIFAAAQVSLTPELAAAVTERTEGWPVGLRLAAMIARDSDGQGLAIAGEDRYVADYLYREAVMHLPPGVQRFLRCTAVLDQLCAPLCDALLAEPGAQEQLRRLEAASMFLVPLDRRRAWYRYHALFREFLLGELRRVEPDVAEKLHLRAADWYQSNGSPAMALEHLLNTTERHRCVQLVTELTLPTYQAGQISTVQRWLSAVGDSAVEDYPPLAVLAGWITVLAGQTAEAERWAAIADAASFDLVPLDGSASFDSARAMLRAVMVPAGPQQALADASFAVAQEPPWSPWRDTARADASAEACADERSRQQRGREDQADDRAADRPPDGALAGGVEVVLDMDLAVGAAADEDQSVDLDHVVRGEPLDGVPVVAGRVRIGVCRDVQVDRGVGVGCHELLLCPAAGTRPVAHS